MDGNGRWAKKKGLLRSLGHEKGSQAVREIVETCAELPIPYLTLYAFSTENWNRPKLEVDTLMKLLVSSLKKEIKTLEENKTLYVSDKEYVPRPVRDSGSADRSSRAPPEGHRQT